METLDKIRAEVFALIDRLAKSTHTAECRVGRIVANITDQEYPLPNYKG